MLYDCRDIGGFLEVTLVWIHPIYTKCLAPFRYSFHLGMAVRSDDAMPFSYRIGVLFSWKGSTAHSAQYPRRMIGS